jgi:hypothetical protein
MADGQMGFTVLRCASMRKGTHEPLAGLRPQMRLDRRARELPSRTGHKLSRDRPRRRTHPRLSPASGYGEGRRLERTQPGQAQSRRLARMACAAPGELVPACQPATGSICHCGSFRETHRRGHDLRNGSGGCRRDGSCGERSQEPRDPERPSAAAQRRSRAPGDEDALPQPPQLAPAIAPRAPLRPPARAWSRKPLPPPIGRCSLLRRPACCPPHPGSAIPIPTRSSFLRACQPCFTNHAAHTTPCV